MISVELVRPEDVADGGHEVALFLDKNGIEKLVGELTQLIQDDGTDHIHLFSESWGNGELSESTHTKGAIPTHHLKICLVR